MLLESLDIMLEQFGQPEEQMPATPGEGVDPSSVFPEETPLKKFELILKLSHMRNVLQTNGIYDDDLDIILQFGPELSYETILALSNTVIDKLQKYIAGIKTNEQKDNSES
jgi:hypothetical protein